MSSIFSMVLGVIFYGFHPLVEVLRHWHSLSRLSLCASLASAELICLVNLLSRTDMPLEVALLAVPRLLLHIILSQSFAAGVSQNWILGATAIVATALWLTAIWNNRREGDVDFYLPSISAFKRAAYEETSKTVALARPLLLLSLIPYYLWATNTQGTLRTSGMALFEPAQRNVKLDIVISYFDGPLEETLEELDYLRQTSNIMKHLPKFIMYVKDNVTSIEELVQKTNVDEVYRLPNIGREGDTYLQHILRNYDTSAKLNPADKPNSKIRVQHEYGAYSKPRGLADHTIFLQHHLSWGWVAKPRLEMFDEQTGYLSLGPYFRSMWFALLLL